MDGAQDVDKEGNGEEEAPSEHAESLKTLVVDRVPCIQRGDQAEGGTTREDFPCSDQEERAGEVAGLQHDHRHCSIKVCSSNSVSC